MSLYLDKNQPYFIFRLKDLSYKNKIIAVTGIKIISRVSDLLLSTQIRPGMSVFQFPESGPAFLPGKAGSLKRSLPGFPDYGINRVR